MFVDEILSLAVLHSLVREGLVPEPDWVAIKAANPYDREDHPEYSEEYGDDEEGFQDACAYIEMNNGALCDMVAYLDEHEAQVPLLRELHWSTPLDIVFVCWGYWDGESDEFELTSLAGLERCTGLRKISLEQLVKPVDLSPLDGLPSIEEIDIQDACGVKDWSPLLTLPALRTARVRVDEEVAAQLTARGVEVGRA